MMKVHPRFYAWGNQEKQDFILAFFEEMGGKNSLDLKCDNPEFLYFIDDLGIIRATGDFDVINCVQIIVSHPVFQEYKPVQSFAYNIGDIVSIDRGNELWGNCEIIDRVVKNGQPYYKLKYYGLYPESDIVKTKEVSQFVSFETAKLLKDIDFPQQIKSVAGYHYDKNGECKIDVAKGSDEIACPYIDDVLHWFRVERKINIIPVPSQSGKSWEYITVPRLNLLHRSPYRETYEEIADEAIRHVCESLLNVKE